MGEFFIFETLQVIMSARIDSTSTQLEWVMLELARHPDSRDDEELTG
jgi:cytochrome P450